ncbi:DNA-binding response regulator [Absiella sp. AM54-8XD]|nr:DNA-binding response regulator [Absiella sp. AM54-8XD]
MYKSIIQNTKRGWRILGKLNIAICDDNMNVREQVKNFLNDFFQHKQIDVIYHLFEDGYDLIQNKQSLDIIILDIEMNKCNGFEVRDALFSQRINSRIIYLSDYKDRLQDAFGKNVYGFVSRDSIL